jgi:hypothetical protein
LRQRRNISRAIGINSHGNRKLSDCNEPFYKIIDGIVQPHPAADNFARKIATDYFQDFRFVRLQREEP